jgi:hypothetical protein
VKKIDLEIFSDFGQIQIWDEDWDSLEPPDWNEESFNDFACFDDQAIFLGVIENDDHNIHLTIYDERPAEEIEPWDHVVEAPLHTPTGNIEIAEEAVSLPPGQYTVRWSIKRVGDDEANYQLDMWPEKSEKVSVLKRLDRNS